MAKVRTANWDRAKSEYPSYKMDEDAWADFLTERPDVMANLLGDIYRATKAEERKQAGTYKGGRRPRHIDGNLDDLHKMITPQYSMDPFPVAVKELIGARALRQFAALVPMDHRELSRMMRGGKLHRYWLEQIAKAGQVSPAFFVEWRTMFVVEAMSAVFASQPNMSIRAVKILTGGQR